MIVGMIARADCRGPNVLNGRRMRDRQPEGAKIALAQRIGADLGRGVGRLALKRVLLVDRARSGRCRKLPTSRSGPPAPGVELARQASRTWAVPSTLV